MVGLRTAGERFFGNFRVVGGPRFKGNLGAPAPGSVPLTFNSLSRVLRVNPRSVVKSGDLVEDSSGQRWAVGASDSGSRPHADYKRFTLVRLTHSGDWMQRSDSTDSVTGLSTNSSGLSNQGMIDYSIESATSGVATDTATNLETNEFVLLTTANIKNNDTIGNLRVRDVTQQNGLSIARVTEQ